MRDQEAPRWRIRGGRARDEVGGESGVGSERRCGGGSVNSERGGRPGGAHQRPAPRRASGSGAGQEIAEDELGGEGRKALQGTRDEYRRGDQPPPAIGGTPAT